MKKSLKDIAMDKSGAMPASLDAPAGAADDMINAFSGKSKDELLTDLRNAIAAQKADGSFDPKALQEGIKAIAPMLNDEQRRRLYAITKDL